MKIIKQLKIAIFIGIISILMASYSIYIFVQTKEIINFFDSTLNFISKCFFNLISIGSKRPTSKMDIKRKEDQKSQTETKTQTQTQTASESVVDKEKEKGKDSDIGNGNGNGKDVKSKKKTTEDNEKKKKKN